MQMPLLFKNDNLPSPTDEKSFSLGFSTSNRPCTTSVCSPAIDWRLINKNELFWTVLANSWDILKMLFCRLLCCNAGELERIIISEEPQIEVNSKGDILTFFIVNPAWQSLCQMVEHKTLAPQLILSISLSLSRYKSGCWFTAPSKN